MTEIPTEYRGWWRIVDTSRWVNEGLEILGPAVLSLTGHADRLRMHCLLAYVNGKPTKTGVSFTWKGAWEFDPMSGSGRVSLGKDGRLKGVVRIRDGDSSTFVAVRTEEPDQPIPPPRATETSGASAGEAQGASTPEGRAEPGAGTSRRARVPLRTRRAVPSAGWSHEWELAIAMAGGNVVDAARQVGLEVPRGTRALWGRSQEAPTGAYRKWLKRKARKE